MDAALTSVNETAFSASTVASRAGADANAGCAGGLLFICGFPSSGTDLLKSILNSHPDVQLSSEFPCLPDLAGYCGPTVPASEVSNVAQRLRQLDVLGSLPGAAADLSSYAGAAPVSLTDIYRLLTAHRPAYWLGNKTPQYTQDIPRLNRLFPNCRFMLVVRDVRDVALSWRRKWGKDPLWCAQKWATRSQHGWTELQRLAPERCLLVKYESLLADPPAEIERLCGFLNLPFSARMLRHEQHLGYRARDKVNYDRPLVRDNAGKWQHELDRQTARRVEEIAWSAMRLFGYTPRWAMRPRPLSSPELICGIVRDSAAALFVGNRGAAANDWRYRLTAAWIETRKRVVRFAARTR